MSFESWTQLDTWNWEHVHGASPWMFSFEFWHITSNCACRKGQVILWNQVSKYLAAFFFWNWFFNILQPCSTIIPWIPWSVLLESLHQATGRCHGELLWRFAGGWWLLLGVDHDGGCTFPAGLCQIRAFLLLQSISGLKLPTTVDLDVPKPSTVRAGSFEIPMFHLLCFPIGQSHWKLQLPNMCWLSRVVFPCFSPEIIFNTPQKPSFSRRYIHLYIWDCWMGLFNVGGVVVPFYLLRPSKYAE